MSWRAAKVDFIPSQKNVLLSFWYDFDSFKVRRPGATIYTFLDTRVVYIKEKLEDPKNSHRRRQLWGDLLDALHQPRLRKIIIVFLESSPPEDHYLPVVEAMKRAWRDDGELPEQPGVPSAGVETEQPPGESKEGGPPGNPPELMAKTYYIAAELYYELSGRQDEFQVLCRQMDELTAFVKRQFKVARLAGTFDKLKGYTYKAVLTGRDAAKKGQLRPHFRQIADNPQVFGEAITGRAREILAEHFN